ncbi:MAG: ATP-binding protein, partial [Thermodesulfovibrionales bacterium]|nr:ATP-binding protein [Thermodesulfovibrionales bacterium]
ALNSILNISLKDMPLIEILNHTLETLLTIPWLAFESRGCIFLVEDDPEVLVMKAQKGLSEPIQKSCARIPFGRCLCGKAALSRKIEFASHINERHEIIYSGIYPHGHYCVPIMFGDRILGVINIYLKEKHKYTQKEETFLTSAANTLAGIIIRKQAEESLATAYTELKSAQSQIIQSEKMASIGQLAAGIAHEINNPVGFIMSNLGSLQKYAGKLSEFIKAQTEAIGELGVKSSEFGETLKKVDALKKSMKIDYIIDDLGNLIRESLDGAERIKKIVQDLKSFSHIDEAEWKMADINAGIESTINIVWNELKYKATVKKEYGDIPLTKCNPGQLNQVFMNMLVNAAHAIEKQGEITVKTWHDSGYIYISISDTGCGIPKENISRIFEPFFTTKEVGKGTGLGLSIAYDIVRKHNGDIIVDSAVGKGTTFTVKIPVVEK